MSRSSESTEPTISITMKSSRKFASSEMKELIASSPASGIRPNCLRRATPKKVARSPPPMYLFQIGTRSPISLKITAKPKQIPSTDVMVVAASITGLPSFIFVT